MELVPGFMLLLQGLSASDDRAELCEFDDGADRLGVRQPAYGHADDPGRRRRGREALFVLSPLFSAARWSLDALGLAVFDLIQPFLGSVVMLGWTTRWPASAA